ncbi:MAG: VOC family protein [Boseongicola sp. SB0670_bin_30]|nr:VOC family protein [Boseongicola sp. SB0670_bin_30]
MPATDIPRRSVGAVALLVPDYQEAIDYFVSTLGFTLVEDTRLSEGRRWVLVSPGAGTPLLLAKADGERQQAAIGNQSGGRVFLFLTTDDFWRDYRDYMSRGVEFEEEPRREAYGTVAVFTDMYGNRWDLIEPNSL